MPVEYKRSKGFLCFQELNNLQLDVIKLKGS